VSSAETLDDLLAALQTAGDDLVVVDVFASWCRACRGVFPKVIAAAASHPDVRFVKLEFEASKDVARALGVKSLPSFLFVRGADGKLETLVAGPSRAGVLLDAIDRHNAPRCSLGGGVRGSPELEALKAARDGAKQQQ
jgi:thioredoxin 1